MKKLRILALLLAAVLAVLPLSGCGGVEQTNDGLTIYLSSKTRKYLQKVIGGFESYSGLSVTVTDLSDISEDDFAERLASELMNGRGPDVVLLDEDFMRRRDVYKMMKSGVFADIGAMLDEYPDMEWEEYNHAVMEQGIWEGKRYLLPLSYQLPVLLTAEGLLAESGFDVNQCSDFSGFIQQAAPIVEEWNRDARSHRLFGAGMTFANYPMWIDNPFNYNERSVQVDTPAFREAAKFYQALYPQELAGPTDPHGLIDRWILEGDRSRLFENNQEYIHLTGICAAYIQTYDKAKLLPVRGSDGGTHAEITRVVAINANSPNLKIASEFVYRMLTRYQYASMIGDIPVHNPFVTDTLENVDREEAVWGFYYFIEDELGTRVLNGYEGNFKPVERSFLEEYEDWCVNLSGATFPTPAWEKLYELMIPYYKGEADYETCIKKAQEQLTLYMTE